MKPTIDEKFIAYGGENEALSTEVFCTFISFDYDGNTLYVAPDDNYLHLAVEGNRRAPLNTGEDGADFYNTRIVPGGGASLPILKCETYGVGGRSSSDNNSGSLPTVKGDGHDRPPRVGDRLRIRGLYVLDYSHSMYGITMSESYSYMRGLYKAGFAHAEIHPYNWDDVKLAQLDAPSGGNTCLQAIVAPVNDQYYSKTYWWNKLSGVAGDLVDEAIDTSRTAKFSLTLPQQPGPGYEPMVTMSEVVAHGNGRFAGNQLRLQGNGILNVETTVQGADLTNPFFYQARFTAGWKLTPSSDQITVPDVTQLSAKDAIANVRAAGFVCQVRGASGRDLYVISQDPRGGAIAVRGSIVTLTLEHGPGPDY